MKQLFLLLILLAVVNAVHAQPADWHHKAGLEIRYSTTAPNGSRILYLTRDDETVVTCVNVQTGAKEWSRPLGKLKEYRVVRFIGNDTVLVGNGNKYEFLNARDGALITSIPISDEAWSDLAWEEKADEGSDTLRPYFEGGIGIYYFDESFQILDLEKLSVVYQSPMPIRKVHYYKWDNVLMIQPLSGVDTFYFVDLHEKRVVYKVSKYDEPLNSSVYQPFAISLNELLLFNERDIQSIDMTTGKVNAKIDVDPDDPEFYAPIIFNKGLYLLVSDDNVQKLYHTKDGKLLWQTPEGAIPGIVEQMIELPNNEALMLGYESDGKTTVYKINTVTGQKLWSRLIFIQDGELKPGHKQGGKFWATVGTIALTVARSYLRGAGRSYSYGSSSDLMYRNDPFGRYGSFNRFDQENYERDMRTINGLYNKWVNRQKKSDGYATVVRRMDDRITFAVAGKIYPPNDDGTTRDYTGEALMTLNLNDGSVAESKPFQMFSKAEYSGFNAVTDMKIQAFDSTQVLVGVHDIYVLRGNALEQVPFGDGQTLKMLKTGVDEITVMADSDGERFDYWRINVAGPATRRFLIARSTQANVTFLDSASVSTSIRFTEDHIEAFPLIEGNATDASFASPKWKLSEKDLDKMNIGDLDNKVAPDNRTQGISIVGGDVLLMGGDGLGFVSSDGACRWSYEWSPKQDVKKLGVTKVGSAIAYSLGKITKCYGTDCPSKEIGSHKISPSDCEVSITQNGAMIVVDRDEGEIHCYRTAR
ncbi:MAG: hypothetical protein JST22_00085 [Bacteroidetes bacterium]|nr:hypothetical protein [Bacteroidota bacterium]